MIVSSFSGLVRRGSSSSLASFNPNQNLKNGEHVLGERMENSKLRESSG